MFLKDGTFSKFVIVCASYCSRSSEQAHFLLLRFGGRSLCSGGCDRKRLRKTKNTKGGMFFIVYFQFPVFKITHSSFFFPKEAFKQETHFTVYLLTCNLNIVDPSWSADEFGFKISFNLQLCCICSPTNNPNWSNLKKKKKKVFCCTCCILGLLTILAPRVSGSPLLVCFSFPSADSLLTDPPAEGRGWRCLLN